MAAEKARCSVKLEKHLAESACSGGLYRPPGTAVHTFQTLEKGTAFCAIRHSGLSLFSAAWRIELNSA
jgi:hypothetical protein